MTTYVDSSVVLRILFGEPAALTSWGDDQPISSELLRVECLRVVDRARISRGLGADRAAQMRADALRMLATISMTPIAGSILDRASDPFPTLLSTLDAVHLATALALREVYEGLAFATHDIELGLAAKALGFDVIGT